MKKAVTLKTLVLLIVLTFVSNVSLAHNYTDDEYNGSYCTSCFGGKKETTVQRKFWDCRQGPTLPGTNSHTHSCTVDHYSETPQNDCGEC